VSHSDAPLIIAGTFETGGVTEEGIGGCEAAAENTVFTELSVATSRVHLVSPFNLLAPELFFKF